MWLIPTVACVGGSHPAGTLGANTGEDSFLWQTCSPMTKGAASAMLSLSFQQGSEHLDSFPWPPFFYRYSRLAGWQLNMVSPGTVCPWNMGFAEAGDIGRHNWVEKLNWRKFQQAKKNKKHWKELKLIAKIWKATENSCGVWYLSICSKLPQMESWVPQDEVKRWKKAIHETTTAGCVSNWKKEHH